MSGRSGRPDRPGRDPEIDALVVDRYLESLLAREPVATDGVPAPIGRTAQRLVGALPRYHPSFRFEEALAARLAAAAAGIDGARVIPIPTATGDTRPSAPDLTPTRDPRTAGLGRPVVIGGVITSAALSLAGAAFVAWRLGRPADDTMTRAVRAVARARLT